MPRWSQTLYDDDGKAIARVCGHSRYRKCSTPGCTRHAPLSCDHPVKRRTKPKAGQTRLHRESGKLFYLREVITDQLLRVSSSELGGKLQEISVEDWFAKADATCDRAICTECVVVVNGLDWCAAHSRAQTK